MSSLSVAFHTLGCKLNQLETESIAQAFRNEGFKTVGWGDRADLYLVNTCTVTSKAEQKARRTIRKAIKDNPAACVIATGCYAQLDPGAVAAIASSLESEGGPAARQAIERRRLLVISGDDKAALLDLPAFIADSLCSSVDLPSLLAAWSTLRREAVGGDSGRFRFEANDFTFHSRASLKIQDGCDNACSYCRVRLARGRSVSLGAAEALRRLQEIEERGYSEAILTGINVSQYRDESAIPGMAIDFPGLLRYLLAGTDRIALRISSTEPDCVTEDFTDAVADLRVRPHFHLSVQSLCDATLARMRRRYRAEEVELAVSRLRSVKDDPFLACDVIAGFPAETAAEFDESYAGLKRLDFAWIHAFHFSPRPGTEAINLPGRVPERSAVERVERLLGLGRSGHEAYLHRWLDREVFAVAETSGAAMDSGIYSALSENYLKLAVKAGALASPRPGCALRCRIVSPYRPALANGGDVGAVADAQADLLEVLP